MIVLIGNPAASTDPTVGFAGTAARAAAVAASAGSDVQLVGRVGEDAAGDALMLALARARVGHVAVLRDATVPTPVVAPVGPTERAGESVLDDAADAPGEGPSASSTLEPADVELGMRYLRDYGVVVVAEPVAPGVVAVAAEAASWAGARLVLVASADIDPPPDAIVLEAPGDDPDGTFAELVGELAAALDRGAPPDEALRQATGRRGWTRVGEASAEAGTSAEEA